MSNAQYLASLVNSSGNIVIPVANGGIVFNNTNTTASPTSTTQNDYETGTWTPTVGGTSTSSIGSAKYTKVGNMVTVSFDYTVTTIGTGSASQIFGLPFNAGSVNTSGSISYYAGMSASVNFFTFYASGTTCVLCYNATAASTIQNNANPILTNGSRIIGSVTYQATF